MKNYILLLSVFTAFLLSGCNNERKTGNKQSINPVIGDVSFLEKFGRLPDENTGDDLRIQTHLQYVESVLRNKDVSHLSQALKQKREQVLNLLYEYAEAGVFPRNYDHKDERRPCFIDKDGRICAVGYLVEKTAGREAAESINKNHKYDEILAMNNKTVENWIAESGLTQEECAMIQPTYGWRNPNYNYISKEYGYSSAVLSGVNVSLATINGIQINNTSANKAVPIAGIISGAGQFALGTAVFFKESGSPGTSNESKKALSMVNIGIGTTTMFLSSWNLFSGNAKNRKTAYNLFSFPAQNRQMGMGFSINRRF